MLSSTRVARHKPLKLAASFVCPCSAILLNARRNMSASFCGLTAGMALLLLMMISEEEEIVEAMMLL
jgi:hypothetical protein